MPLFNFHCTRHNITTFTADQGGFQSTNENDQPLDRIYFMGIIDLLQSYNARKRLENAVKRIRYDGVRKKKKKKHAILLLCLTSLSIATNFCCSSRLLRKEVRRIRIFAHWASSTNLSGSGAEGGKEAAIQWERKGESRGQCTRK